MKLDEADRIIAASREKAVEMGLAVSIAVVDSRGDLIALAKLDGARYYTPDIARGKALVSGAFGRPSGGLAEAGGSAVYQAISRMNQGQMLFSQGAVPVIKDGHLIGAVGVSGATGPQDEEIATTGAAAY